MKGHPLVDVLFLKKFGNFSVKSGLNNIEANTWLVLLRWCFHWLKKKICLI